MPGPGRAFITTGDDGPWDVAGGRAMWTPGPSLGASVLRIDVGGARVLFSGRLAGFDPRADATSAFATEADHSAAAAGKSLFALAEMDESWDFEWLLPRGGGAEAGLAPLASAAPSPSPSLFESALYSAPRASRKGCSSSLQSGGVSLGMGPGAEGLVASTARLRTDGARGGRA